MIISGKVIRHSGSTAARNCSEYPFIQIGDDYLEKILVPDKLQVFFKEAVSSNQDCTFHFSGKMLAGVEKPNGDKHTIKADTITAWASVLLSVLLIPVFLIGLMMLPQVVDNLQLQLKAKNLKRKENFIAV